MIKIASCLALFGVAAVAAGQLGSPYSLSGINSHHGGYLGGYSNVLGYPNGGYQNIGVDPYYGGAGLTTGQLGSPYALSGVNAHHGGYLGGYGAAYPNVLGGGYQNIGYPASSYGRVPIQQGGLVSGLSGYGGYGVPATGYPLQQGGVALNRGLAVNEGVHHPYTGSTSKTEYEIVTNHLGGASRQWVQRYDKN